MSVQNRHVIRFHGKPYGSQGLYMSAPMELARDGSLGDAARSVAMLLWSHDEGFQTSQRAVKEHLGKGWPSITKAFTELSDARWMVRQRIVRSPGATREVGEIYHLARHHRFTIAEAAEHGQEIVVGASVTTVDAPISYTAAPVLSAGGAPDLSAVGAPDLGAQRSANKKCKEESNLLSYTSDPVNLWHHSVEAIIKDQAAKFGVTTHDIYRALGLTHDDSDLIPLNQWRSDIDALELISVS